MLNNIQETPTGSDELLFLNFVLLLLSAGSNFITVDLNLKFNDINYSLILSEDAKILYPSNICHADCGGRNFKSSVTKCSTVR